MIRISITGKARSGKDTLARIIDKECNFSMLPTRFLAFADPIKKIAHKAFPQIPRKWLYGSSEYRSEIIPGAFKNGVPLTVRQLLIDIGNDFGRAYNPNIWINNFNHRYQNILEKQSDQGVIIATDVRRRNEFDFLKSIGFYNIRILRHDYTKIDDISETDQDRILDSEFDAVIENNKDKKYLKLWAQQIRSQLPN
jgi:hypothetical protein